jgi:hypothetical protein
MRSKPKFHSRLAASVVLVGALALVFTSFRAASRERRSSASSLRLLPSDARAGRTLRGQMPPMMHMPVIAPLFIQNRDFTSTLVLVNDSILTTYADVTLQALDGREITTKRVQFPPHSQQRVEIGELLASVVSRASTGRITVMQSPDLKGMPIAAQLSLTYRASDEPNYIDEETSMPSAEGSQTLRAVADAGNGSPLLAITSLAESGQHILVDCIGENGSNFSKSIELLAEETLLTEACSDRTIHGGDYEAVSAAADDGLRGPVGVALTSDAMPGSFAAFGLARHHQQDSKFFSALTFNDPKMSASPNTVFTGVPVGRTALLPEGRYVPQLALTNFSAKPVHVRVKYAQTSGSTPVAREVANLTLPAKTSKGLSFQNLDGDAELRNSYVVISDGAPGDLMAKLASTSDSSLREVELLGKDEKEGTNGGNHPWSLEKGSDSTLLLFNHSTEPENFSVVISTGDTTWQKTYELAPMETEAISFRTLIQDQSKDDQGHTLPRSALGGQVTWLTRAAGVGKGRLLQSNRDAAMARSFSCASSIVLCGLAFNPNTPTFPVGSTVTFGTAQVAMCDASGEPQGSCSGTAANPSCSYTGTHPKCRYTWNSNNSVASISGSFTTPTVSLKGVAPGTSNVFADVLDTGSACEFGFSATATVVQVPTSLSIVAGTESTNAEAPCTTGGGLAGCGLTRTFKYQVNDQNGHPITVANMPFGDVICNTSTNQLNLQGYKTTCGGTTGSCSGTTGPCAQFTDPNGQFTETLTVCAPACKKSGSCTTAGQTIANQTWTVSGHTLSSDVKSISYQCNKILVNGK